MTTGFSPTTQRLARRNVHTPRRHVPTAEGLLAPLWSSPPVPTLLLDPPPRSEPHHPEATTWCKQHPVRAPPNGTTRLVADRDEGRRRRPAPGGTCGSTVIVEVVVEQRARPAVNGCKPEPLQRAQRKGLEPRRAGGTDQEGRTRVVFHLADLGGRMTCFTARQPSAPS